MTNKLHLIKNTFRLSCVWVATGDARTPLACVWVKSATAQAMSTASLETEPGRLYLCA
ncbi:MAG: hypothetical protein ABSE87_13420 [Terracidiphilus sp.]|jgi:hypothetical protein